MSDPGSLHEVSRAIGSLETATKSLGRSLGRIEGKIDGHHAKIDGRFEAVDDEIAALRARVDAVAVDRRKQAATVAGVSAGIGGVFGIVGMWVKGLIS